MELDTSGVQLADYLSMINTWVIINKLYNNFLVKIKPVIRLYFVV